MTTSLAAAPRTPFTVPDFARFKREGRPIVMLTAYDACFARAVDAAGVDVVLVGDSLGMVVQGHANTLPVTIDHMVYHSACVARGLTSALLVADCPFGADATPERALAAGFRLLGEGGAGMVKLEGAGHKLETVRYLVDREVPVCGHLGLTPQSVLRFGGYKVQGRGDAAAEALKADASALADAGASALVLECVPTALASEIRATLPIPVIGIGAGNGCDGQVLVLHDLLGLGERRPRFVKDFLAVGGSVQGAVAAFAEAVRNRSFPGPEHSYA